MPVGVVEPAAWFNSTLSRTLIRLTLACCDTLAMFLSTVGDLHGLYSLHALQRIQLNAECILVSILSSGFYFDIFWPNQHF